MLGRSSKPRGRDEEGGVNEPLLNGSDEDLPRTTRRRDDDVLFTVDDSDSDELASEPRALAVESANGHADPAAERRGVRFQEDVQVIAPPLRSTMQSRETGE